MKLDFKILWFDDQPGELMGPKEMIGRHLQRQGFNLLTRQVSNIKDLASLLPKLEKEVIPDLILMDWNMGNGINGAGQDGSDAAKAIRSRFKYQEIVFYSAAAPRELRKAICTKGIDGVFCVNRTTLQSETIDIINIMLRKVIDINQMRGIVMSHVSEFDGKISDCLVDLYARVGGEVQKKILESLHSVIKKYHESGLTRLEEKMGDSSLEEYMKWSNLDNRYGTLKKVLSELTPECRSATILETFGKFRDEVLSPRNALAHAKEVLEGGKTILKHKDETYDDARLTEIRKAILCHSDNLESLHQSIQAGHFTPTAT